MTLFDDGQVFVHDLAGEMGKGHRRTEGLHARNFGVKDIGMLRCSHFRMMSLESLNAPPYGAVPIAATVTPEGTAGASVTNEFSDNVDYAIGIPPNIAQSSIIC